MSRYPSLHGSASTSVYTRNGAGANTRSWVYPYNQNVQPTSPPARPAGPPPSTPSFPPAPLPEIQARPRPRPLRPPASERVTERMEPQQQQQPGEVMQAPVRPPRAAPPPPSARLPPAPFVQRSISRPLPNPYPRAFDGGRVPFRVVNTTPTPVNELGGANGRGVDEYFAIDRRGPGPSPLQNRFRTDLGSNEGGGSSTAVGGAQLRPKKKSVVNRFLKGVRRLPSSVFGYGVGVGKRSGTITTAPGVVFGSGTEGSTTEYGEERREREKHEEDLETLPQYASQVSTPQVARLGTPTANIHNALGLQRQASEKTPMPDVVRLSDSLPMLRVNNLSSGASNRGYRIPPPSEPDSHANDESQHQNQESPAERTTYMVYDPSFNPERDRDVGREYSRYSGPPLPPLPTVSTYASNLPNRTPPPVVSRLSSAPALSYVSEEGLSARDHAFSDENHTDDPPPLPAANPVSLPPTAPLQPVRPLSFQSGTQRSSVTETATVNGNPRISSASQATQQAPQLTPPRRTTPAALIPSAVRMPTPPRPSTTPLPPVAVDAAPASGPPPAITTAIPAASGCIHEPDTPVSVQPQPASDYAKMGLPSLRSQPSHHSHSHHHSHHAHSEGGFTGTRTRTPSISGTSFSSDPSFSSQLSPVERFFKVLYHMPWISHDRVTVDYTPGVGVGVLSGFRVGGKGLRAKAWAGMRDRSKGEKERERKRTGARKIKTWYPSLMGRSRRSSSGLDLLSSEASKRSVLGLTFDHHGAARKEIHRHRHHHHHHEHRRRNRHGSHHHHRHGQRHKRRRTTTTLDTGITGTTDATSLVPPMFPYVFPTYPLNYAPMPMPMAPAVNAAPPAGPGPSTQLLPPGHPAPSQPPNTNANARTQHSSTLAPASGHAMNPFYAPPPPGYATAPTQAGYHPMMYVFPHPPPPAHANQAHSAALPTPISMGVGAGAASPSASVPAILRPGAREGHTREGHAAAEGGVSGGGGGLHPPPGQARQSPPIPGGFTS